MRGRVMWAGLLAVGLLATGRATAAPAAERVVPEPTAPFAGSAGAGTLSVMTYNIEGLPWPVRHGRAAAATHIAAQLSAMRAAGTQPHVVVLQEAFGPAQRAIGREAGYRYVAFGPDRTARNEEPMDAADRAFAAGARRMHGEDDGKWAGSGLAILSDYPIGAVERMPFPAFACAGLDCLANKGVMMATVEVPGMAQPVAVVATHLNSKHKSTVDAARYDAAFMRQVRSLDGFLRTHLDPGMPFVFAGDTNIGRSAPRAAAFQAMLAALPRAQSPGVVRTALGTCLQPGGSCRFEQEGEARRAFRHGKDLEVYGPGTGTAIEPVAISASFGHDAQGHMLSDHIGYTATYRLPAQAGGAGAGSGAD